MLTWDAYRQVRYKYFGEKRPEARKNYRLYKDMKQGFQFGLSVDVPQCTTAPVKKGFTRPAASISEDEVNRAIDWLQDGNSVACKEGNTPNMCYNNTPTKTETQIQRDYLERRLNVVAAEKRNSFEETFKINNPESPTTYKALIDAIKNGDYTLDEKKTKYVDVSIEENGRYYGSPFDGIKWTMKDAPDFDGYHKAIEDTEKQKTIAKDAIMSGVYADGLKAIQDFETWQPTGKAN